MRENLSGLVKLLGISFLLIFLWVAIGVFSSGSALGPENLHNVIERSSLYAICGIGVAFVIMTSGIDLSLGSLACLSACLFVWLVQVDYKPVDQSEVLAARKLDKDSKLTIRGSEGDFRQGQWLRLTPAKGSRLRVGMVQVTAVNAAQNAGQIELTVNPAPSRSEKNKDGVPIGIVSRLVPVDKFELKESNANEQAEDQETQGVGSQLRITKSNKIYTGTDFAKKNRILLASETGALAEGRILQSTEDGGTTVLGLDRKSKLGSGNWHWMVVKRLPRVSLLSAFGLTVLFACSIGALHGVLVGYWKLQPFVVTLCGFMIYRGAARWLTGDQSVGFGTEYSDTWLMFSREPFVFSFWSPWPNTADGFVLKIPVIFLVLLGIAAVAIVFMNMTIWGRYLLATGRNEQAAKFSGINTSGITMLAYVVCGLLAAVAGLVNVMDTGSISPTNGNNYWELYAIAAAVLGGCSLRGGEGSVLGVVIGATLMQTIRNGVNLLGIPSTVELAVLGVLIMLGVSFDEIVRRLLAFKKPVAKTENTESAAS